MANELEAKRLHLLHQLVEYANATTRGGALLARDAAVRRGLAALAAEIEALRLLFYRVGALIETRETVRHESALAKVMADELGQKLTAFAMGAMPIVTRYSSLPATYASTRPPAIARCSTEPFLRYARPRGRRLARSA